ncbi:BCAS2 family protein [Tothia fuscella]|uniref:BCAS2 family protein n=1 Tax=Tothia fuscella TaxID=1048955 RepID=A0A9P4NFQ5_9PEZI|nr:BCAS2 family protein [Tothia fuscella]
MPLGFESTQYLSHIDGEIDSTTRESIISLIHAERPKDWETTLHPNIPETQEPKFTPLLQSELERRSQGQPFTGGVDKSRYEGEALGPPSRTTPHSDTSNPELLTQWRTVLQRAYSTSTYLTGRNTNLSLLETYGKNAWLIGNSQLENILKGLEVDLVEAKRRLEGVEEERRARMEGVKAEMEGLDGSWRGGLRGIVEVEVATEGLRREILERRRAGVGG